MTEKIQFPRQNSPTTLTLVRDGKPIAGTGECSVKGLLHGESCNIEGGIGRLGKYSPKVAGGLIQSFEVTVDGQGPMMIIKDLFGLGPKDDLTGDEASAFFRETGMDLSIRQVVNMLGDKRSWSQYIDWGRTVIFPLRTPSGSAMLVATPRIRLGWKCRISLFGMGRGPKMGTRLIIRQQS